MIPRRLDQVVSWSFVSLAVLSLAAAASDPRQASQLQARHRAGQTLLTFAEVEPLVTSDSIPAVRLRELRRDAEKQGRIRYRVYRSSRPIQSVARSDARRRTAAADRLEHRLLRRSAPGTHGFAVRRRRGRSAGVAADRHLRLQPAAGRRGVLRGDRGRRRSREPGAWAGQLARRADPRNRRARASRCCSGRNVRRSSTTSAIRRCTTTCAGSRRRTARSRASRSTTWSQCRRTPPSRRRSGSICTAGAVR